MPNVSYTITVNRLRPIGVDRGVSDLMQATAIEIHLWPLYVARHSPDESRHFLSVLSQDPDTSMSSSLGSNAMQDTALLPWQLSVTL